MENSSILSDMEVNKDPQDSDSSEGLDDPLTLSQLLPAVPSFGGGDLDWPLPFPFTTWEEALGLDNLLEFHQSPEPDWEAFAASIARADCNEALLPQIAALSQPDRIPSPYHQADWYAAMASPVDWNTLLPPQARDTTANGDIAQISHLPDGPSIGDVQAERLSSINVSDNIEAVSDASQLALPTSSEVGCEYGGDIPAEVGNECHDDISSRASSLPCATDIAPLVRLAVPASTVRLAHLAPLTNNTEQLLSQFPQATQSSASHPQPHRSSRSRKSKPYTVSTKRPKSPDSEAQEMDMVVVQAKDFEDLCSIWHVNQKDLKFLLERDHPCYD
ncbi:hypothetical protein F5879DRAFT_927824, partial [Lentinula edodes]